MKIQCKNQFRKIKIILKNKIKKKKKKKNNNKGMNENNLVQK